MKLDAIQVAGCKSEYFNVSDYKRALSRFPTGVAVVTAIGLDGHPVGLIVNSFASVSLDPPVVLWSLRQESSLFAQFMEAEAYAVSVLAREQQGLVQRFSSRNPDRFAGVPYSQGVFGLPLLKGAVAVFECRKVGALPVGDHVVLLGQVLRFSDLHCQPLVMHSGGFVDVVSRPLERMADETNLTVARVA